MLLHALSRDKKLYNATAIYSNGEITIVKGSIINRRNSIGFKPSMHIADLRNDDTLFENGNILAEDLTFNNLSSAATFVTGRIANGMIVWKTEDSKYVRYTLKEKDVL